MHSVLYYYFMLSISLQKIDDRFILVSHENHSLLKDMYYWLDIMNLLDVSIMIVLPSDK